MRAFALYPVRRATARRAGRDGEAEVSDATGRAGARRTYFLFAGALAAVLAGALAFAGAFLTAAFLAGAFLTAGFLAAGFFAGAFLAAGLVAALTNVLLLFMHEPRIGSARILVQLIS